MTSSNKHSVSPHNERDAHHVVRSHGSQRPKTVDEIIAERSTPPLTVGQLVEKWRGVFEEEFWEEVRRDALSR
jgi:hypothetical protein